MVEDISRDTDDVFYDGFQEGVCCMLEIILKCYGANLLPPGCVERTLNEVAKKNNLPLEKVWLYWNEILKAQYPTLHL